MCLVFAITLWEMLLARSPADICYPLSRCLIGMCTIMTFYQHKCSPADICYPVISTAIKWLRVWVCFSPSKANWYVLSLATDFHCNVCLGKRPPITGTGDSSLLVMVYKTYAKSDLVSPTCWSLMYLTVPIEAVYSKLVSNFRQVPKSHNFKWHPLPNSSKLSTMNTHQQTHTHTHVHTYSVY